MTGFLHEQEFSRGTFVKAGGALIVGFSTLGALLDAKASKAASSGSYDSFGPYDSQQVDSWIAIHADNTASTMTAFSHLHARFVRSLRALWAG